MNEGLKFDKEYRNELENHFLKHIGHEHVENIWEEQEAHREAWETIEIPDSLNQWFADFQHQQEKKVKKESGRKGAYKILKKAAVVLLFIIGVNYILIVNVDAYRYSILNSFYFIQNKFTKINIKQDDTSIDANIPDHWNGWYYLTYRPSGYYLFFNSSDLRSATLLFRDEEGHHFSLQQTVMSYSEQQLDSEEGEVQQYEVNGEKALYTEKDGLKILSWIQDDLAFYMEATGIDIREMIKIAKSIKKNK